ncbi:MAG: DNA polymerase III subunit epsilon [Rhodocyclaceae bacterium]|nr:DNA polymerase III subunit epsilon [Rhodocyclaceae bacterium]
MRRIVLDTETTGLDFRLGHRVIEIGCVEMIGRKPTGRHFHRYINPDREIDAGAVAIHGLTNEFLTDKPKFGEVAAGLLDFVRDAELIIHNAAFDVGFLNHEMGLLELPSLDQVAAGILDTLKMAREIRPGRKNSLDALCAEYGVDNARRELHGALLDAELLAEVWLAMTRGQESLVMDLEISPAETACLAAGERAPFIVLRAGDEELAEHERVLREIDKASKGKCLFRLLEPAATTS